MSWELLATGGWWALLTADGVYATGWGGGGAGVAGAGVRYISAKRKKRKRLSCPPQLLPKDR